MSQLVFTAKSRPVPWIGANIGSPSNSTSTAGVWLQRMTGGSGGAVDDWVNRLQEPLAIPIPIRMRVASILCFRYLDEGPIVLTENDKISRYYKNFAAVAGPICREHSPAGRV